MAVYCRSDGGPNSGASRSRVVSCRILQERSRGVILFGPSGDNLQQVKTTREMKSLPAITVELSASRFSWHFREGQDPLSSPGKWSDP
jgi:hypothetical protein